MAITFSVTYDIVTPESARDGDTAEHGWFWPDPLIGHWPIEFSDIDAPPLKPSEWTLHELVSRFGRGGFEDGGRSFYSADSETDYRSGDETRYAIHPPRNVTAASYKRLRRIFCGR